MADFKLCISNPKDGKTYQKELKDPDARALIGLNVKGTIKGELIGLAGYELQITGGSDKDGFPMRSGILGVRKRVTLLGGVGFRGAGNGIKRRKTVCGHKINENIAQVNLKVIKEGSKNLAEAMGVQEKQEEKKEEKKEKPKAEERKKEEKKPKESEKKETKAEGKKEEKPKTGERKEVKPEQKQEKPKVEEVKKELKEEPKK